MDEFAKQLAAKVVGDAVEGIKGKISGLFGGE